MRITLTRQELMALGLPGYTLLLEAGALVEGNEVEEHAAPSASAGPVVAQGGRPPLDLAEAIYEMPELNVRVREEERMYGEL